MPERTGIVARNANRSSSRVGSVSSTIAILRLLATVEQPIGVNAISRRLQLTPSSCFNILKTLVDEDFVNCDVDTKAYSLGGGAIAIARRALDPAGAFELVRANVETLAERRLLTVGLWRVMRRERIMLIGYAAGTTNMRIHLTVGQRLPLLMGAVGRCIAAMGGIDDTDAAKLFAEPIWQEPISFADYMAQVEDARKKGWGLDEGHFVRGVTTIAVPVFDQRGAITNCLSATMFAGQYPPSAYQDLAAEIKQIADKATQRLSGL